jgi:hypothetical protein
MFGGTMKSNILTFGFILLMLVSTLSGIGVYRNPRVLEGTFHFSMAPDESSIDRGWDLRYWVFPPSESKSQRDVELTFMPEPDWTIEDEEHGNRIAFWDFGQYPSSDTYRVDVAIRARVYEVHPRINPDQLETIHDMPDLPLSYTVSEPLIEVSERVLKVARDIVGEEENPYHQGKAIFDRLLDRLTLENRAEIRGTEELLALLDAPGSHGANSAEYALLYCALCRSLGIPSRPVSGFIALHGLETWHVWAELYLGKPRWIPADPAMADDVERYAEYDLPQDPDRYFGRQDNRRLTFARGSNILLNPGCPYQFEELLMDGRVALPVGGAWNFEAIPNASFELEMQPEPWDSLYVDEEFGLELRFPKGWHSLPSGESEHYIVLQVFVDRDNKAKIILAGVEFPEGEEPLNAEETAHRDIQNIKKSFEFYDIEGEGPLEAPNFPAYGVLARGGHHPFAFKDKRVYITRGRQAFFLTCTCEEKHYPKYEEDFNEVIKSFTVWPENRIE